MNLIEGLQYELKRNRELLVEYEALPNQSGAFGAMFIREKIELAEKSIAQNDIVEMTRAYAALKESE